MSEVLGVCSACGATITRETGSRLPDSCVVHIGCPKEGERPPRRSVRLRDPEVPAGLPNAGIGGPAAIVSEAPLQGFAAALAEEVQRGQEAKRTLMRAITGEPAPEPPPKRRRFSLSQGPQGGPPAPAATAPAPLAPSPAPAVQEPPVQALADYSERYANDLCTVCHQPGNEVLGALCSLGSNPVAHLACARKRGDSLRGGRRGAAARTAPLPEPAKVEPTPENPDPLDPEVVKATAASDAKAVAKDEGDAEALAAKRELDRIRADFDERMKDPQAHGIGLPAAAPCDLVHVFEEWQLDPARNRGVIEAECGARFRWRSEGFGRQPRTIYAVGHPTCCAGCAPKSASGRVGVPLRLPDAERIVA